jgi:serine hydrolase
VSAILLIPGLNGSGPAHWQTHWERLMPNALRVVQADWEHPAKEPWIETLVTAIVEHPDSILVAHSLGCALVANTVQEHADLPVQSAMLVSPSDPDDLDRIEDPLRDFAPMPRLRFPFRTIVVASENDPYVSIERARFFATRWGAEFANIGKKGHINADSGLGEWPEGLAILSRLTG